MPRAFEVRRLAPALGAEITGLDLATPLDEAVFAAVHRLFLEHQVLVFREQRLGPGQQIAFSARFGPLDQHPADDAVLPDHPEVLLVSTRRENGKYIGLPDAGPMWHSDLSYREKTALGSMLYAIEVPDRGGDTGFANMYHAYESLPGALKRMLEGRRAVFLSGRSNSGLHFRRPLSAEQQAKTPPVTHPAVRTHPETGQRSIFVNPQHTVAIEGMEPSESADLLTQVFAHCQRPELLYFHSWRTGDLTFWDNRCVLHVADHSRLDDPTYIRHLHRTSIGGDEPFYCAPVRE